MGTSAITSAQVAYQDSSVVAESIRKIYENGYPISLTKVSAEGDYKAIFGPHVLTADARRPLPEIIDHVVSGGGGVSVSTSRIGPHPALFIIDIDKAIPEFPIFLDRICPPRVPAKMGSKWFNLFLKVSNPYPDLVSDIQNRTNSKRNILGVTRTSLRMNGIDVEFIYHNAGKHAVIPPSKYKHNPDSPGPEFYTWCGFGSRSPLSLEDVPFHQLPEMPESLQFEIYLFAKNPQSSFARLVLEGEDGNFHDLTRDAVYFLVHEGMREDEILDLMFRLRPNKRDDAKYEIELKHIIRGAIDKIPEPKPSDPRGVRLPRPRVYANWLEVTHPVENLVDMGSVYFWEDERWNKILDRADGDPEAALRAKVLKTFDDATNNVAAEAVRSFGTKVMTGLPTMDPPPHLMGFANGVLNVHTLELSPPQKEHYQTEFLPYEWDPEAKCPLWQEFMLRLFTTPEEEREEEDDTERTINMVQEFLGYSMFKSHQFQKMLFIIGPTGVGKSTLFDAFAAILPRHWVSHIPAEDFGEPNHIRYLAEARINIASEVGRKSKDIDHLLLRITSGEQVTTKILYQNAMSIKLNARLVFHGNSPPESTDYHGAIKRRMLIAQTTDLKPKKVDVALADKLRDEGQGVICTLVRAYHNLLKRGHFLEPSYSQKMAERVRASANSVMVWLEESVEPAEKGTGTSSAELYYHYSEYCKAGNYRPVDKSRWGRIMNTAGHPTRRRRGAGGIEERYYVLKIANGTKGEF